MSILQQLVGTIFQLETDKQSVTLLEKTKRYPLHQRQLALKILRRLELQLAQSCKHLDKVEQIQREKFLKRMQQRNATDSY